MDEEQPNVKNFGNDFFGDVEFENYLGPGNVIEGTVSLNGRTLLAGSSISGRITGRNGETEIYVGPSTNIEGDMKGSRVVFGGVMNGTIDSPRIEIIKEGIVKGDIITDRRLTVDPGAKLSARVVMKKKRKTKKK